MSTRTLPTLLALTLGATFVAPATAQSGDFSLDRFDLDGPGPRRRIMRQPPPFVEGYVREPSAPPPPADEYGGELPGTGLDVGGDVAAIPPVVGPESVDEPVTDLTPLLGGGDDALPSLSDMDPSGAYTVASGQGMGHVAQALLALIEEDSTVTRIPDLWVPPAGGRVGLPHVVACYNRRAPEDWSVNVGEVLALPPLQHVWTIIEHVKAQGTCPADIQRPEKKVAVAPPAEGMEDFEFGGGFKVELGRTYSHYGAAARHYLASFMPKDELPPLYPAPGRFGMLHLMACFNNGDSQDLDLRAGQILRVPPPIAIPDASRFLEQHGGACPPDFRPAGTKPRGAVASATPPSSASARRAVEIHPSAGVPAYRSF